MSDTWNKSILCRCCQAEDGFRSLGEPYIHEGTQEIYADMIRDCLNIIMKPSTAPSYSICDSCVCKLRDATVFKRQVLACERSLEAYRKQIDDEINADPEIKSEDDSCSNEEKTTSMDIEDIDDQPLASLRTFRQSDDVTTREAKTSKHQKAKNFSCKICHKKFTYNGFLEVHMRQHTGEKTVQCRLCDSKYTNNKELNRHISENHSDGDKYPCPQCTETFDKARLLKKHLTTHFEEKFSCNYCDKEFQRKKG
ncbi:zinc finger protein 583-like isoform X2 [Leguminivora glycinivorella]|uniref:zinc finger protein 583-like isoform X2 n=1 Tax=Leguminivora glycinivorella TaxID=1035111 RepID=UPI00200DB005|nr:zinc finger protein 583-like isoform X2 [Leguminivora glycinivorella]